MRKSNKIYFFGILIAVILILVYTFTDSEVNDTYMQKLTQFRADKNHFFAESTESPIEDKEKFKKLDYYQPDLGYRILADIERLNDTTRLRIRMTDGKEEVFTKYAHATFKLQNKTHRLLLLKHSEEGAEDQLFLPFSDKTNGFETYGGGRYLDLDMPKDDQLMIDFNFAYNPFCAYNANYSCPLPPAENRLDLAIKAGEKVYAKD